MPCSSTLSFLKTWQVTIKIAKSIETDGAKKKNVGGTPLQRVSAKICHEVKRPNKLVYWNNKRANQRYTFQQRWHPRKKTTQYWSQKCRFMIPKQTMFVPRMVC
jgi:hypothetical protein